MLIAVPISSPQGISCFALTSQKLQLSWNPLSEREAQGVLKGYKVFLEFADLEDPGYTFYTFMLICGSN